MYVQYVYVLACKYRSLLQFNQVEKHHYTHENIYVFFILKAFCVIFKNSLVTATVSTNRMEGGCHVRRIEETKAQRDMNTFFF
jgi:hypothetical protein